MRLIPSLCLILFNVDILWIRLKLRPLIDHQIIREFGFKSVLQKLAKKEFVCLCVCANWDRACWQWEDVQTQTLFFNIHY